jgi:cold shock CspA family protein
VEKAQRRHHQGNLFRVRIEVDAPRKELAVTHTGPRDHAHEDVYVAIRDAFRAAVRQLEDHVRERGGKVKTHVVPLHGTVRVVDHPGGFGFVETVEGEVYFHRNSVIEAEFDAIEPGSKVRLEVAEREGDEGWQATTVRLIGKHRVQDLICCSSRNPRRSGGCSGTTSDPLAWRSSSSHGATPGDQMKPFMADDAGWKLIRTERASSLVCYRRWRAAGPVAVMSATRSISASSAYHSQ